jgi:hypothetical protein
MTMTIATLTRVALTLPLLAVTACATMNVDSYAERGFDPKQYRTYAWGPNDQGSTGDPRLDNNEFFDTEVKADVDRVLAAKGFVKAVGQPDVIVHYHANFSQEIDVRNLDRDYRYCEQFDCRPYVYDAGTLFIDLVDPRTNRIVWRGWAEGSVEDIIDDQDALDRRVEEAVDLIAEELPGAM